MTLPLDTPILLPDYCIVCLTENDLQHWGLGDPKDPMPYTVCKPCMDGGKFRDFLASEFEQALAAAPDKWRKNPDGTWHPIGCD